MPPSKIPILKTSGEIGAAVTVARAGRGKVRATYRSSNVTRMRGEMRNRFVVKAGKGGLKVDWAIDDRTMQNLSKGDRLAT
jgi:hypothetical protein